MKKDLTQGNISKHLIQLSLPMVISITASMSFNLVDTYFVGQLGVDQLAALSFSFPVVLTILNLSIGIAIGTSSVLSRMLGKNEEEQVRVLSSVILGMGVFLGIFVSIIGMTTVNPLFSALGANEAQLVYVKEYMLYAYPAMGLRLIAISISGTYRANGITLIPSVSMLVATIFNLILDPILIFGIDGVIPPMGIPGAGLATLLGNFLALIFEFYMAKFKYNFFSLKMKDFSTDRLKEILSIAAPASLANALNPIALNIANYLITLEVSTLAVAGFGVATKIQFFSMIPILALSSVIGPVVGQNFGSDKLERSIKTLKLGLGFCFIWALLQGLVLINFSQYFSALFTDNGESIAYSSKYLKWIGGSLFGYSFVIIYSAVLNAIGKPINAFLIIFSRSIGLFLFFYLVLDFMEIENSVIFSIGLANLLLGIYVPLRLKSVFAS